QIHRVAVPPVPVGDVQRFQPREPGEPEHGSFVRKLRSDHLRRRSPGYASRIEVLLLIWSDPVKPVHGELPIGLNAWFFEVLIPLRDARLAHPVPTLSYSRRNVGSRSVFR